MKRDFISLYDECFDDVYRYIYFKTGSKWDADDIVSDVFQRAFEKFETVNRNPRAWLFTIARNALTDYYRRPKNNTLDENMQSDPDAPGVESRMEEADTMHCLKKSLLSLPEEELEVVRLKYFSNLKYREISEIVGKDETSLKVKMSRIIKKLRMTMQKCMEGSK